MARITTFELDRWSDPDEHRHIRHIGMVNAKDTFDKLKVHLEQHGLLPDEYFSFSGKYEGFSGELPDYDEAVCVPRFGESEGIYLDISLACFDKDGRLILQKFATGKTLGETADDYFKMFRIAAECSLMLNGRGKTYERKNVDIVLTEKEAETVANSIELDLCADQEPEVEVLLSSALNKITHTSCTTLQFVICHGKNDYSLWSVELPIEILQSILEENNVQIGTLDELISSMDIQSGCEMRFFTQRKNMDFAFYAVPERYSLFQAYSTQGDSIRGNKEQIMEEICAEWEPTDELKEEQYQEEEIFEDTEPDDEGENEWDR